MNRKPCKSEATSNFVLKSQGADDKIKEAACKTVKDAGYSRTISHKRAADIGLDGRCRNEIYENAWLRQRLYLCKRF